MVDSCQALQEAKNAIAAKMGGGWPCMEKMDLTCIGHGGHVGWKVCPASNLLGFYIEPVTVEIVEQFGFACPKVMFPSSNWDVLEAASVFSKGFQLGSVAPLAFDDSAGRIRVNDTGPFLMFVRTIATPKTWLANLGHFPLSCFRLQDASSR